MAEQTPDRKAAGRSAAEQAGSETASSGTRPEPGDTPPLTVSLNPGLGGMLTVQLAGDLDMDTVDVLGRALDQVLRHGFTTVALDLSQLRFCDSSGIRGLLFGCAEAERVGCRMFVVRPRPFVRRVFELTGVTALLGLTGEPES